MLFSVDKDFKNSVHLFQGGREKWHHVGVGLEDTERGLWKAIKESRELEQDEIGEGEQGEISRYLDGRYPHEN